MNLVNIWCKHHWQANSHRQTRKTIAGGRQEGSDNNHVLCVRKQENFVDSEATPHIIQGEGDTLAQSFTREKKKN